MALGVLSSQRQSKPNHLKGRLRIMRHKLVTSAFLILWSGLSLVGQMTKASRGRMPIKPNSKIAQDLRDRHGNETVDVIVRFKKSAQGERLTKARARLSPKVTRSRGQRRTRLDLIRSSAYRVQAGEIETIANDPDVEFVAPDRTVGALLDYARPAVGADIAQQYGWTGSGVTIAIIDTDIDSDEEDLLGEDGDDNDDDGDVRVLYQESFVPGVGPEEKDNSHATHVAGIAVGTGKESSDDEHTATYKGVAPGADLVHLRVLDKYGQGQDSWVIAAIERAVELKDQHNIRVINLSLGRPVFESHEDDPLCQAVKAAWEAGIVVVVAAGNMGRDNSFENQGYGTVTSPGNSPYVITVGAMKTRTTPRTHPSPTR